ncbi:MAG: hypothetical protein K5866_09185 [Treponema sp.]|nr:hypothetical protein [Treponema sp.]
MKKTNKILAICAGLCLFTFTSCFNNVFYEILQDVSPEDATVSGPINSITRFKAGDSELLVLAGNHPSDANQRGLRYKSTAEEYNDHGYWNTFPASSLPFDLHAYDYYGVQDHTGQQIIKVVADENNLYLVTAEYENNSDTGTSCPSKIHLWTAQFTYSNEELVLSGSGDSDADKWTDICADTNYLPIYIYDSYCYSAFSVFCTNSTNPEHRYAYIRYGSSSAYAEDYQDVKIYKLNGSSEPSEVSASAYELSVDSSLTSNICSAVYYPDASSNSEGVVFFNTIASITNETSSKAPTRMYFAYEEDVMYSDAEKSSTCVATGADIGETVISMALNSDCIILGRGDLTATSSSSSNGGVEKLILNDGVPSSTLGDFSDSNAQSQLLSTYFVTNLLSVDPEKAELDNTMYATLNFIGTGSSSSVSYNSIGLWAYYTERHNWNRE